MHHSKVKRYSFYTPFQGFTTVNIHFSYEITKRKLHFSYEIAMVKLHFSYLGNKKAANRNGLAAQYRSVSYFLLLVVYILLKSY